MKGADLWRLFGPAVLLVLILSVFLLETHTRRVLWPTAAGRGDQGSYLRYARQMRETNYEAVGGRNRMPVYPFLLSRLWTPGMSEAQFLARAQTFNVNLAAAFLLLLFFVYRAHFPILYAASLIALTGLGVFYYRAGLAQTEVLFYCASFGMFVCFWRTLVAPNLWLAALSGALAGLAYLCKASVLPAVVLLILTLAAQASKLKSRRIAIMPLVVLATFLLVIWPYIHTSKRVFGHYFYNVNSTFYFWCDSWQEAHAFSEASDDRRGWPTLPPEQIPSPRKYWQEHSVRQIISRLGIGLIENAKHDARLDGYYKYVLLLGGVGVALAVRRRGELLQLMRTHRFLALFLTLYFSAYAILYAWYEPLSGDSRFILALFLPFTFTASKLIARLAGGVSVKMGGFKAEFLSAFAATLLVIAAVEATFNAFALAARARDQTNQVVEGSIKANPPLLRR